MASPSDPSSTGGILWFHRDLRTSDHAGLREALRLGGHWEALVAAPSGPEGPAKTFLHQCQDALELNLRNLKIPLHRIPEAEIKVRIQNRMLANPESSLFTSRRYNHRDLLTLENVLEGLNPNQIRIFEQGTLYQESQLPFSLDALPRTFTPFQKRVDSLNPFILDALPAKHPELSRTPTHATASVQLIPVQLMGKTFQFVGGEFAAHQRISDYLWNRKAVTHYSETRNGLLRVDDSSKLSPYLAQGCISARQVHHELLSFESAHGPSTGTRALRYELQWRDYFKFLSLRSGERLFQSRGLKEEEREASPDPERFQLWCSGQTGNHFIDANLRELKFTGWMSNRGRQNVASYFAKVMKLPWLWGAEWFEKTLIDFDVETNQGNWMYLAGVGTDPRDRVFNPDLQAQNYDPDGAYRERWSY